MPITVSSGQQIDLLIADLSASSSVTRDAAVARLTIIGTRAVGRLIAVVESAAPSPARVSALRALEGIASPRALAPALASLDDRDDVVALAAVPIARTFLRGAQGASVVDHLTQVALDVHRHQDLRLAAIQAISDLESGTLKPLWKSLAQDANEAVRSKARAAVVRTSAPPADSALAASADGDLLDLAALRHTIAQTDRSVSLAVLHRLVERIREREMGQPPTRRAEWTMTRAAAHLALANRGSRLGLYDLRESLEDAMGPLPVEFLAALSLVGDASCLEAIAAAYVKAGGSNDSQLDWWRQHLAGVFRAIVKRERITRRHAVARRIAKRWGDRARGLGVRS